jgi:hypothetical protein
MASMIASAQLSPARRLRGAIQQRIRAFSKALQIAFAETASSDE